MISVSGVTKCYGKLIAIDNISFQVEKGEILGFLGPNGAGKTTTMRMITGYTPPTEGEVRVGGFDVVEDPIRAKKQIGYLPENLPLYNEMTVRGYLDFVADLKNVPGNIKPERISFVMEKCGIADVKHRLIGNLSKGYRQRIGIAQALVNDPAVLILDEPTIGLDPKQIIEIRELIKGLAGDRTIILSTHILPEVNMICTRVIIIHKGKIALEESLDRITGDLQSSKILLLKINRSDNDVGERVRGLPHVSDVSEIVPGEFRVTCEGSHDIRELVAKTVVENGWGLLELRAFTESLEEIFLKVISAEGE
jgi:gliding motility-associated transport system ATP-binding protein